MYNCVVKRTCLTVIMDYICYKSTNPDMKKNIPLLSLLFLHCPCYGLRITNIAP